MKTAIGFLFCVVAVCFLSTLRARAQGNPLPPDMFRRRVFTPYTPGQPISVNPARSRIPGKKASQYTAADWGKLIDSTWGPGQSATDQLNVFDTFWNMVDQQWAGFPNLTLNWDSLRTVYRPQIGSGLSRGRFYALMSRMWLALLEHHSWIYDAKVDTIFGVDPLFDGSAPWRYKSGVPLLIIGTGWWDLLGAPVTPMPDSSGLVYRTAPGNPLGLEPGDLIVGYDGIPWKRLYGQLVDDGLPVSKMWSYPGSTPESRAHAVLSSVGWNWGLFDTIDIVKYSSGDTIHLSTASLATLSQTVWASDQLPVAGVPMPQGAAGNTPTVTWGVVKGTNIGYVYAWDWYTPGTPQLFHDAIYDLRSNKKVEGLIIDFRLNWGGDPSFAFGGLSQLFNFDPTTEMSFATRNSSTDHFGFTIGSDWLFPPAFRFSPTAYPFDRPIAVLLGPACHSGGDWTAFWMRFHPMARSFGKPTNGAVVSGYYAEGTIPDAWPYQIPTSVAYSNVRGEGILIHKGIQPDEEVWLTRDGVAKGKDEVVERALTWITSLTYTHDMAIDRPYARPHLDSITVTARLTNPLNHATALSAIVTDTAGVVRDSVSLYNDGMHWDGQAGDSIWGCRIPAPSDEGTFKISLRTDDITQSSLRRLPNMSQFTTAGPLKLDSIGYTKFGAAGYYLTVYVRNYGLSYVVRGATVVLRCSDTWVTNLGHTPIGLPDLPPGATEAASSKIGLAFDTAAHPTKFNLKAEMALDGWTYWTDSTKLIVTGIGTEQALPVRYVLEQNYPNPFNPSTTVRYSLPHKSQVSLSVYNTLGQQVATMVQGQQEAGTYEVKFDGSALASGMYFYRIQAGDYVQTRKLLLVK